MAAREPSTLDLVNFENVRDGGIIETPTAYAMLVKIEPREWLTLSEERRTTVYVSFLTFLRGLQFPTQFLMITTEFDGEQYINQFVGPNSPNAPSGVSTPTPDVDVFDGEAATDTGAISATDGGVVAPTDAVADSALLGFGRQAHADWIAQTLQRADVRDRQFFVAVAVNKSEDDDGGRLDVLRDALPGGTQTQTVDAEGFYLDEVWARAQRVASQLPRTQVEASVLDSREAVLGVLYRIYRDREPPISFNQGTLIRAADDTLTDALGEPLGLEQAFEDADRQAEAAIEEDGTEADSEAFTSSSIERPETVGARPYGGRVQEEYIETVDESRLLQWYARNIGPIGGDDNYLSPLSVYVGTSAFVASLVLAVGALGIFLGSAEIAVPGVRPLALRELSFSFAASSLPVFLLSLVVLLPSRRLAAVFATLGVAVSGGAITLFEMAYPAQWSGTPTGLTATVLQVYAAGLFVLVAAVGVAIRARRAALEHVEDDLSEEPDRAEDAASPRPEMSDD